MGKTCVNFTTAITPSNQQERSREKETKKPLKIKRVISPTLLDNFLKPPVYTGQDADMIDVVLVKAFIEDASHRVPFSR